MRALELGHPSLLGARAGAKSGAAVPGGCAHPLRPKHFRRMLPTQGWALRDAPPHHRRLEGVVQPGGGHRDLIAGTTRNSCKGWKEIGAQRSRRRSRLGFNPPVAQRGHLQSQGRLPWTEDRQGLSQRVLHAGL